MSKVFISVERRHLLYNRYVGPLLRKPPFCVQYEDGRPEAHYFQVELLGPAKFVYDINNVEGDDPVPHVWVEADEATVLLK